MAVVAVEVNNVGRFLVYCVVRFLGYCVVRFLGYYASDFHDRVFIRCGGNIKDLCSYYRDGQASATKLGEEVGYGPTLNTRKGLPLLLGYSSIWR